MARKANSDLRIKAPKKGIAGQMADQIEKSTPLKPDKKIVYKTRKRSSKKDLPILPAKAQDAFEQGVADSRVEQRVKREQGGQRPLMGSTIGTSGEIDQTVLQNALLSTNPDAEAAVADWVRTNYPCRYFVPNIGQENAILPLKDHDLSTDRIKVGCFTGGNGVGKTTILANLLVGLCCGVRQLNSFFDGWKIFEKFEQIRQQERRHVKIRLICHKNAMQEDGGLYNEILKWFPKGWMVWSKNHSSYFSSCEVRNPIDGKLMATIQVRTFDQERTAHAGDTLDAILCDEPMPQHLFSENIGRLRTARGGIIWFFCTPLDVGGWMKDLLEDEEDVCFTSASIWDNCKDWHPDPERWSSGKIGYGHVLTRGYLSRSVILDQIKHWRNDGPEVALSRETGKFTHLAGAILKEFCNEVHVMQHFPIPKSWPIYCVMDPHNGGKPNFAAWFAQDPDDNFYLVAEYPPNRWDTCNQGESIPYTCKQLRDAESRFRDQIAYRFADPAIDKFQVTSGKAMRPVSHLTEYVKEGFSFRLSNNDPAVGMSKLRQRLFYDKTEPAVKGNLPSLRLFDINPWTGAPLQNVAAAMQNWIYKKGASDKSSDISFTSAVTEKWKDPVDVCRYLCVEARPYRAVVPGGRDVARKKRKIDRNPRRY